MRARSRPARLDAALIADPDAPRACAEAGQPVCAEKSLGRAAVNAMQGAARAWATLGASGLDAGMRPGSGRQDARESLLALPGMPSACGLLADEAVPACAASMPCPEPACRPRSVLWPLRFRRAAAGAPEGDDSIDGGYQAGLCTACAHGRSEAHAPCRHAGQAPGLTDGRGWAGTLPDGRPRRAAWPDTARAARTHGRPVRVGRIWGAGGSRRPRGRDNR